MEVSHVITGSRGRQHSRTHSVESPTRGELGVARRRRARLGRRLKIIVCSIAFVGLHEIAAEFSLLCCCIAVVRGFGLRCSGCRR